MLDQRPNFPLALEISARVADQYGRWEIDSFVTGNGEGDLPTLRTAMFQTQSIDPNARLCGQDASHIEATLTHSKISYVMVSESFDEYTIADGKMKATHRRRIFVLSHSLR